MSKKIRYQEPEMPDSLKELMNVDLEHRKRSKNSNSKKLSQDAIRKNKRKSTKKRVDSKSRKGSSKEFNKSDNVSASDRVRKSSKNHSRTSKKGLPSGENEIKRKKVSNRATKSESRLKNERSRESFESVQNHKKTKKSVKNKYTGKNMKNKHKKIKKKSTRPNFLQIIIYTISIFIGFLINGGDKSKYLSVEKKKEMDINFRKSFSLIFVLFLFIIMVLNIISPSKQTSVAENRELEQRPRFSISDIKDGSFSSNYSKYISDQFINRSKFIKTKARFDLLTGKKDINGVIVAKDGYLMEGFNKSDSDVTKAKVDAVNTFTKNNPKLKISMMLVPNKVEIYKNLLPKNYPADSQREYCDEINKMLDSKVKFVNLFDIFEKNKNDEQLYFKTDHHWTTDGAFLGYTEYCKSSNIEPLNKGNFNVSMASDDFLGSLYYKNGASIGKPENLYLYIQQDNKPIIVKYYDTKKKVPTLYNVGKLKGRDPYEVFTGGNHTQIKIRTNIETEKKLLIIKDSYANAFLPFVVNNFAEINVVDLRYYTGSMKDILNNNDITDVLILGNVNTFNSDASILNIVE